MNAALFAALLFDTQPATDPADALGDITQHIRREFRSALENVRFGTIPAAGASYGTKFQATGESANDTADYHVLVPYSTGTYGATGGPQASDKVMQIQIKPHLWITFGKVV